MTGHQTLLMVIVSGKDRPGITARLSQILTEHNAEVVVIEQASLFNPKLPAKKAGRPITETCHIARINPCIGNYGSLTNPQLVGRQSKYLLF